MARPKKEGLDYFPMDVDLHDAEEYLEAKYGVEGYGVLIKLWSRIYKKRGYYCNWDDRAIYLFSKSINLDPIKIKEIVNFCLDNNIFNNDMYGKYQILTSTGIQERYVRICTQAKRAEININPDYNLHPLYEFTREETKEIPEETPGNSGNTPEEIPQSKVKKKKVNKIKTIPEDKALREIVKGFYRYQYDNKKLSKPIKRKLDADNREDYFTKGVIVLDKLLRIDGYTEREIGVTLRFAVRDEFWSGVLLSISDRLRARDKDGLHKFDKIYEKIKRSKDPGSKYRKKETDLRQPVQNDRGGGGFQSLKNVIDQHIEA